jgi:hypothetical protein
VNCTPVTIEEADVRHELIVGAGDDLGDHHAQPPRGGQPADRPQLLRVADDERLAVEMTREMMGHDRLDRARKPDPQTLGIELARSLDGDGAWRGYAGRASEPIGLDLVEHRGHQGGILAQDIAELAQPLGVAGHQLESVIAARDQDRSTAGFAYQPLEPHGLDVAAARGRGDVVRAEAGEADGLPRVDSERYHGDPRHAQAARDRHGGGPSADDQRESARRCGALGALEVWLEGGHRPLEASRLGSVWGSGAA